MLKVNVCLLPSPSHEQVRSLFELVEWLVTAHESAGVVASATLQRPDPSASNIILGAHLATAEELATLPAGSVLWNTELMTEEDPLLDLWSLLAERHTVWDASVRNSELLGARGVRARVCAPCWVEGQDRLARRVADKDIDVVLWGQPSGPRAEVIAALRRSGLRVECASGQIGKGWEATLARARVYLDLPAGTERPSAARHTFLLHNGVPVVCAWSPDALDPSWVGVFRHVDPHDVAAVVEACAQLVTDDEARHAQALRGRERLTTHAVQGMLRDLWSEALAADLCEQKGPAPLRHPLDAESPELSRRMTALLDHGDAEGMLDFAFRATAELFFRGEHRGKALFLPTFDDALHKLAHAVVEPRVHVAHDDTILHIATEVYEIGGHTRVMEDIVRATPDKRHLLVLTDIAGRYVDGQLDSAQLRQRFSGIGLAVFILRGTRLTTKVRDLVTLVSALAPGNIFLNAHHYDAVAYGAIAGTSAPRVHFLHHADHAPSLGATRSDYHHLDLTPACHEGCRSAGLDVEMLHLTVGEVWAKDLSGPPPLAGVTCATPEKYKGTNGFSYPQLLAELFSHGVERMFHIGPMDNDHKESIQREIEARGQDPRCLEFVGAAPSISEAIHALPVRFYLNSHPTGGGKAIVEALGLGLPIVTTRTTGSSPLLTCDMTLGAGLVVRELSDVAGVVARLRIEHDDLAQQSRSRYDAAYAPAIFEAAIARALLDTPPTSTRQEIFGKRKNS